MPGAGGRGSSVLEACAYSPRKTLYAERTHMPTQLELLFGFSSCSVQAAARNAAVLVPLLREV